MPDADTCCRVAPLRRDHRRWLQHKPALPAHRVRNGERRVVPCPSIPENNIAVEHPRTPTLSTGPAAEFTLQPLQRLQQLRRRQVGDKHRRAIGVAPPRRTDRRALGHRGKRKHLSQPRHLPARFSHHPLGRSKAAMPFIRTQGDKILVRTAQTSSQMRPYSCGRRSRKKPMPARCLAAVARSSVSTSTPVSSRPNSAILSPHSLVMKLWP